jgi:hypothetical protein
MKQKGKNAMDIVVENVTSGGFLKNFKLESMRSLTLPSVLYSGTIYYE